MLPRKTKYLKVFVCHRVIREESPNLPIPKMTYDYYSVTGQGVGGMYRPYRSDIGVLHDPRVVSTTFGGGAGGDFGPTHLGVNASITYGKNVSEKWDVGAV